MTHQPTVLIAEDDPVFRRVLTFTIEKCGFNVIAASDGLAASERYTEGGIDFLVTDLQMPRRSGLELLDFIHANPTHGTPPTILCTAKGFELDRQEVSEQYGLVEIMNKPFSPRKLSKTIENYLGETASHSSGCAHE